MGMILQMLIDICNTDFKSALSEEDQLKPDIFKFVVIFITVGVMILMCLYPKSFGISIE